ncbi:MAG: 30S ribosomal protein THX [Verrucomicrobiota bacterium]
MGKGDKRTSRGKTSRGTYGNSRSHKKRIPKAKPEPTSEKES